MNREKLVEVWARTVALGRRAYGAFERLPLKTRRAVGASAGVIGVLVIYVLWSSASKDSVLHLKVQHNFRSAQINVEVDGDAVYSGKLYGSTHKKLGFLAEGVQGSMSQSIPVSAGKHRIVVRVAGDDGTVHEDAITGEFVRHNTRDLAVSARHSDLDLTWQGGGAIVVASPAPAPAAPPSNPGWLNRYASTIVLSITGSIISALTGYAIRELPNRVRAQRSAPVSEKPRARSAAAGG